MLVEEKWKKRKFL